MAPPVKDMTTWHGTTGETAIELAVPEVPIESVIEFICRYVDTVRSELFNIAQRSFVTATIYNPSHYPSVLL